MKKIFIVCLLLLTTSLFGVDYTVKTITGNVKITNEAVQEGQILSGDTTIIVKLGSLITLIDENGKEVTIRRSGKVEDLFNNSLNTKIGGNVVRTNTGEASSKTRQTGTASARASDQSGDNDIAAE